MIFHGRRDVIAKCKKMIVRNQVHTNHATYFTTKLMTNQYSSQHYLRFYNLLLHLGHEKNVFLFSKYLILILNKSISVFTHVYICVNAYSQLYTY